MIRTPQATAASLSRKLRAQGVAIRAADVRAVMEFFCLQKKRYAERAGSPEGLGRTESVGD